ncbi:MAG: acetyl-CoA hydrolase/transferase C-terminal domain-containing protein [Hyphomonadaceae bacterium]
MPPKQIHAEEAIRFIAPEARALVQGAAGESLLLADALEAADLRGRKFTGVFLPGVNGRTYGAREGAAFTGFFVTPQLRGAAGLRFLPLGYSSIRAYLSAQPPDVAVFTISPPDAHGICSFGVAVDFLAELWPSIPVRVAHVNPRVPRTSGQPGIPFDELTACVTAEHDLIVSTPQRDDEVNRAIGARVAGLVGDGATVQAGIGKTPSACMRALGARRRLRIHSGLIEDWIFDLESAGALDLETPVVAGVALAQQPAYARFASSRFEFRPVSHTHNPMVMSSLRDFVTINSAMQVDLLGQVYSEAGPSGLMSGPGGALDFATGARLAGGLRIIALSATADGGRISRLVGPGGGLGPVTLASAETDVVVTEFGIADMRGCDYGERASRLMAIAAPHHRGALSQAWRRFARE